jgi:hypothetical protein
MTTLTQKARNNPASLSAKQSCGRHLDWNTTAHYNRSPLADNKVPKNC